MPKITVTANSRSYGAVASVIRAHYDQGTVRKLRTNSRSAVEMSKTEIMTRFKWVCSRHRY